MREGERRTKANEMERESRDFLIRGKKGELFHHLSHLSSLSLSSLSVILREVFFEISAELARLLAKDVVHFFPVNKILKFFSTLNNFFAELFARQAFLLLLRLCCKRSQKRDFSYNTPHKNLQL